MSPTDFIHSPSAPLASLPGNVPSSSAPPAPRPEPSLLIQPASYFEVLDLSALFPAPQPLEVELGSGDGSFIVQYAKAHPDMNFLGVERLLGRLRKIDRKGRRLGLVNLRALRVEAGYFLEFMLPPQSVRALHIYFPDPWPKRKHRKNRLINARFTELALRVLNSAGIVHLRTDDSDYFGQMTAVFRDSPAFREVQPPAELSAVVTDFEREFHARGVPTLSASYQRTS